MSQKHISAVAAIIWVLLGFALAFGLGRSTYRHGYNNGYKDACRDYREIDSLKIDLSELKKILQNAKNQ